MCMSLKRLYFQASAGTLPSWKEGLRNTEEQKEGKKLPCCISTRHQQREAWPCFLLLLVGLGPALTLTYAETQVLSGQTVAGS